LSQQIEKQGIGKGGCPEPERKSKKVKANQTMSLQISIRNLKSAIPNSERRRGNEQVSDSHRARRVGGDCDGMRAGANGDTRAKTDRATQADSGTDQSP
jgi:hypothetical protein